MVSVINEDDAASPMLGLYDVKDEESKQNYMRSNIYFNLHCSCNKIELLSSYHN